MTSDVIVTLAITGVSWIVFLSAWLTKLSMKVSAADKRYDECRSFRSTSETHIQKSLVEIKDDMAKLNEKMAIVCTDINWTKDWMKERNV